MPSEERCNKCMRLLGESNVCANCGHKNGTEQESETYLDIRSELKNGRYVIGCVMRTNDIFITYAGYDRTADKRVAIREFFPKDIVRRDEETKKVAVDTAQTEVFKAGLTRFMTEHREFFLPDEITGMIKIGAGFGDMDTGYVITDEIDMKPLGEYMIAQGGKLSADEAVSIIEKIAAPIKAMHKNGFVCLTLSPKSVFVDEKGDMFVGRMDNGDYLSAQKHMVNPVNMQHEIGFFAPEQENRPRLAAERSDVYSLAAILLWLLTGSAPQPWRERVHNDSITRKLIETNDKGIADALTAALCIEPQARTASVEMFIRALHAAKKQSSAEKPTDRLDATVREENKPVEPDFVPIRPQRQKSNAKVRERAEEPQGNRRVKRNKSKKDVTKTIVTTDQASTQVVKLKKSVKWTAFLAAGIVCLLLGVLCLYLALGISDITVGYTSETELAMLQKCAALVDTDSTMSELRFVPNGGMIHALKTAEELNEFIRAAANYRDFSGQIVETENGVYALTGFSAYAVYYLGGAGEYDAEELKGAIENDVTHQLPVGQDGNDDEAVISDGAQTELIDEPTSTDEPKNESHGSTRTSAPQTPACSTQAPEVTPTVTPTPEESKYTLTNSSEPVRDDSDDVNVPVTSEAPVVTPESEPTSTVRNCRASKIAAARFNVQNSDTTATPEGDDLSADDASAPEPTDDTAPNGFVVIDPMDDTAMNEYDYIYAIIDDSYVAVSNAFGGRYTADELMENSQLGDVNEQGLLEKFANGTVKYLIGSTKLYDELYALHGDALCVYSLPLDAMGSESICVESAYGATGGSGERFRLFSAEFLRALIDNGEFWLAENGSDVIPASGTEIEAYTAYYPRLAWVRDVLTRAVAVE